MGVGGGTSTSKCERGLPVGVDGSMLRKMTSAYHGVVLSLPPGGHELSLQHVSAGSPRLKTSQLVDVLEQG